MEQSALTRTDVQLLNVFRKLDDHEAFLDLVRKHTPWIFARCKRIIKDQHLAEDAVQEVFLGLAKNAVRIRDGQALTAWLSCAAHRISTRIMLAQKRFNHHLSGNHTNPSFRSNQKTTFEKECMAFWDKLEQEIARLSESDQHLLKRYFHEGYTIEKIAEEMKSNFHAMRTRLHRCKVLLRKRLKTSTMIGLVVAMEVRKLHGMQAVLANFSCQNATTSMPRLAVGLPIGLCKAFGFAVSILAFVCVAGYGSFSRRDDEAGRSTLVMPVIKPRVPYQQKMIETYERVLHSQILKELQKLTLGSNQVELVQIETFDTRLSLQYRLVPKLPTFLRPRVILVQFILQSSTGYVEIKADLEGRDEWRLLKSGQHLKLARVPEWNWEWVMDLKPLNAVEYLLQQIPVTKDSQEEDRLHVEKVRKAMQPYLGAWWDPVHACKLHVSAMPDCIRWEQPGYQYTIHLRDFRLVQGEIHLGSNVVEKRFWNKDRPQLEWLMHGQKTICNKIP